MVWTKMQTAVVTMTVVLLAAGTTTVTVKEIQDHRTYPWQTQNADSDILRRMPPQVVITRTKYPVDGPGGGGCLTLYENGSPKTLGISQSLEQIVSTAYDQIGTRMIFQTKVPPAKYDFIANLPSRNAEALQREIKRKLGLTAWREMRNADVLLLKVQNAHAGGLQVYDAKKGEPTNGAFNRSLIGGYSCVDRPVSDLAWALEVRFKTPVIDQTGLTDKFNIDMKWDESDFYHPNLAGLKTALLDQLGLVLIPTNMPIEMLVIDRARK